MPAASTPRRRHPQHEDVKRPPSFAITLATIIFPVVLMLSKALADIVWNGSKPPPMTQTVLDFIGEPLVALTLAVLLAMVTFAYAVGLDGQKISARIGASVGPIAVVILIVGAGGGFKQTLIVPAWVTRWLRSPTGRTSPSSRWAIWWLLRCAWPPGRRRWRTHLI